MSDWPVQIRTARSSDAPALAALLTQLGYPNTPDEVQARLTSHAREADCTFVACEADVVHGLAALHLIPMIHRDGYVARLTAFIVDESARGRGIGSALLEACEAYAVANAAERLEITSGDGRSRTHEFYSGRGYSREGQRFTKWLHARDK